MHHALPRPSAARLLLLATSLLLATMPALAQYKWKDSQGQVHVSDRPPPPDVPDRNVLQRPAASTRPAPAGPVAASPAASAASAAPVLRVPIDPELEARRKRGEAEARARAQADEQRLAAQRAENCQRARQQLAMLDNGRRLVRDNDRGEPVVLDEAARAAEAQRARQIIGTDCR